MTSNTAPPKVAENRAAGSPAPRQSPGRRTYGTKVRGWATIAAFVSPALVLFSVLVLAPIGVALYTSLFRWNGYMTVAKEWVGLKNFKDLLTDDVFIGDLKHAGLLILLALFVQLPMALGLAMLLNQKIRFRAVYRVIFFAPYVVSEVITAVLFTLVLAPDQGLLDQIIGMFGMSSSDKGWLGDPDTALYVVFFVITWKYFGFYMILFLAARQSIPNELAEAASIDGAGPWQAFRRVTLPLLGPTIRIAIFLSIIGTIQLFDMVWVLTKGGPQNATETMAVTMYWSGFRKHQVGYASAISMAMFIISFIFALFYQRFVMRRDVEGAATVVRDVR